MGSGTATTREAPRTNRKAELVAVAARLFAESGYHAVGVDDIAAAVGITGGGVYRHFRGKSELLACVMSERLDLVDAAIDVDEAENDPIGGLATAIDQLVTVGLDARDLAILVNREARNLDAADHGTFQRRLQGLADRLADLIAAVRPDLTSADASVAAVATLAVCSSPAFHVVAISRDRAEDLLRRAATAVAFTPAVPRPVPAAPPTEAPIADDRPWMRRSSRREQLLNAATDLFGVNGYGPTRLEDIGAAAGVTGPAIYEHFASKGDLLVATISRAAELSDLTLTSALAASATPTDALRRVLGSYVRNLLDHPMTISVLQNEIVYLPEDKRKLLRQIQREYVDHWVVVLEAARPELETGEARFLVHCVLAIVNRAARMAQFRVRHDAEHLLVELAHDVFELSVESGEDA